MISHLYYLSHFTILTLDFLACMFCVFFDEFDSIDIRTKVLHSAVRSRPVVVPIECPNPKPWLPNDPPQTESPRTVLWYNLPTDIKTTKSFSSVKHELNVLISL